MENCGEIELIIPAEVVSQMAEYLDIASVEGDEEVLAALDDYFKTLNNGQYSPLSGEHNNASNQTEVYHIARRHNVNPSRLMKYLKDMVMFDKLQKSSLSEDKKKDNMLESIMREYETRVMREGYYKMPPIDRVRYTPIPGLEGPFMLHSGKVVYYDPAEGKYYDRDTDLYMSDDEYAAMNEPPRSVKEESPPGMESWIKDNKPEFKKQYGSDWEKVLYSTAWKRYNSKNGK